MDFNQEIARRIVVATLIRRGDEFLFCWKASNPQKNTHINQWQMVGGGVEGNETLCEAVKREVSEETNLRIKNINFVSKANRVIKNYKGTGKPCLISYHEAISDYDGGVLELSSELEKVIWLKPSEFHLHPINPETVRVLTTMGLYPRLSCSAPSIQLS